MDINGALRRLEWAGFTVTFQPNPDEANEARYLGVSTDGWFATRVRLPVGATAPEVHIGIRAERKPDAFVYWRPSSMPMLSRGHALVTAFEFVEVVRHAMQ